MLSSKSTQRNEYDTLEQLPVTLQSDPRTGLEIVQPPSEWRGLECLRGCVTHAYEPCVVLGGCSIPTSSKPQSLSDGAPVSFMSSASSESTQFRLHLMSVVSDSCLYILDAGANALRCCPIACMRRLHVVEVACVFPVSQRSGALSRTSRQHAAQIITERSEQTRNVWRREAHEHLRNELKRHSGDWENISSSRGGTLDAVGVIGIEFDQRSVPNSEHGLVFAVPVSRVSIIVGMILELHRAHTNGFGVTLAVVSHGPSKGQVEKNSIPAQSLPLVADIVSPPLSSHSSRPDVIERPVPYMLGCSVAPLQSFQVRMEPLRSVDQLARLLEAKRCSLADEAHAIDAEFRRIRQQIIESLTWEQTTFINDVKIGNIAVTHAAPRDNSTAQEPSIWVGPSDLHNEARRLLFGGAEDVAAIPNLSSPCSKCKRLEELLQAHPNIDKVRLGKAEDALVEMEKKWNEAKSAVAPIQEELLEVTHALRLALIHIKKSPVVAVTDVLDDPANWVAIPAELWRDITRLLEPFGRHVQDQERSNRFDNTLGDEIRRWRHLVAAQEQRHQTELKVLKEAFAAYDSRMLKAVHEALRAYHPSPGDTAAQVAHRILKMAKSQQTGQSASAAETARSAVVVTPSITPQSTGNEPRPQAHPSSSRSEAFKSRWAAGEL